MSSGVQLSKNGAVIGTGAALPVRTVGYRPRRVTLINENGLAVAEWTDTMPDGSMLKEITAGTKSFVTGGNGITPLSDGFSLGADADMNVSGEKIHWVAHE